MKINTKIMELRQNLVGTVNSAGLPACIVDLVLKEVLAQVQQAAAADLAAEQSTEQEANNG